jgi:hypothetical protein
VRSGVTWATIRSARGSGLDADIPFGIYDADIPFGIYDGAGPRSDWAHRCGWQGPANTGTG